MAAAGQARSWRVTMRRVHLWLGLSLGLLLALAGLTGSALVFYTEIDDALVPALRAIPAGTRPSSWQAVYDRLKRDHPHRDGAWRIEVTPDGGPIPIRYYAPVETKGRAFAPLMLWLDPRDLGTVRAGFWGEYPTTWIYALHWQLLSGETGEIVMAIAGGGMLAMLATGLIAWWPRPGQWRRALRWKRRAEPIRRLYDLHKWAGLAGLVVLLVVAGTGVMLELPAQTRSLLGRGAPLFVTPRLAVRPGATPALPLDMLVARAAARFPDAEPAWIETPASAAGTVRVNLWRRGEPSRRFPRTNVWLDPYDGAILAVRDGRREVAGDVVLNWLHPLHAGEALGMTGRVLVLLSGLATAALFVTGFLRWVRRRRPTATLDRAPSTTY